MRLSPRLSIIFLSFTYVSTVRSWQHIFTQSEIDSCHESCFTTSVNKIQTVKSPIWFSNSSQDSFSRSKMSAVNDTAWEHWYFEAFSEEGDMFVTSFARDPSYKLFGQGVLRLELRFAWSNGTSLGLVEFVDESVVRDCCGVVQGSWTGPGKTFSFLIAADMQTATIRIRGPAIEGSIEFYSQGPSRYPDGNTWPSRHASTQFIPHFHFTEAIVAARANVQLTVSGSPLHFSGHGGHNHFWAAFDWFTIVKGWRLARGVVGPYAFSVWHMFSKIDSGAEYRTAMLLKGGRPVFSSNGPARSNNDSTASHVIFDRKHGGVIHSNYLDQSSAWTIDFVSPESDERWNFVLEHKSVTMDVAFGNASSATYFIDIVSGGKVGGEQYKGYSLTEQAFFPDNLGLGFMFQVWSYFLVETGATVLASLWATSRAVLSDVVRSVAWKIIG